MATVFALSFSAASYATTYAVTNCSDNPSAPATGSLRWAAAQAINSGDIIDATNITDTSACSSAVDGFTNAILLNSTVTLATGVTVNGPNTLSSNTLAISGQSQYLVFSDAGQAPLTINNLGIIYGSNRIPNSGSSYVLGGCISAYGGITLSGVRLDHCYAIAPCCTVVNAMGGAVSSAGSITLTNSYVSHCLAISRFGGYAAGGALSGYGPVTLTNTDIAYARAYAVSGNAMGGAIMDGHHLPAEGKVTLSNSQYLSRLCGCILCRQSPGWRDFSYLPVALTDNSSVSHTHAIEHVDDNPTGGAMGGGIFAAYGVSLSYSVVSFNAIYSLSSETSAMALGGSIFSGTYVTLDHSDIEQGRTYAFYGYARGGGIYSAGPTTIRYSQVFDSAASGERQ